MYKILEEHCTPSKGSKYSAGLDLRSKEDITILAGETKIIPLGVVIDQDWFEELNGENYPEGSTFDVMAKSNYIALHIRSGLAAKGLVQNNGVGVVDLDYPKELGLIVSYPIKPTTISDICKSWANNLLQMLGSKARFQIDTVSDQFVIKKGDRVAQSILIPHLNSLLPYQSEEERTGGFGSTGID